MGIEGTQQLTPSADELEEQQQQAALNKISGMNDIAELEELLSVIKEIIIHWEESTNKENLGKKRIKQIEKRKDLMEQRINELKEGGGEDGKGKENLKFRLAREFAEEK